MLKFQAGIMERQELKADQLGKHLTRVAYHLYWLVPTGLSFEVVRMLLENRPLWQKIGSIAYVSSTWALSFGIMNIIRTDWAEEKYNRIKPE